MSKTCSRHGVVRNAHRLLVWKRERKIALGRTCHKRRLILIWVFKKYGVSGLDSSSLGQGPVPFCCAHGNESSGSVKCGEFLSKGSSMEFTVGMYVFT